MHFRDLATKLAAGLVVLALSSGLARPVSVSSPVSMPIQDVIQESTTPYNVLLYVIDTWRADHCGLYGYPRDTTPFIDSIAEEGVAWSGCRSASTWTWPSVVSLMTGLTLSTHKALERPLAVHPGWTTFSDVLEARGYSTQLITSNNLLDWEGRTADLYEQVIVTDRPDRRLHVTLDAALRDESIRPFFIHAQPYGPHTPYEAPSPFDSLFIDDSYYGALGDVPVINRSKSCTGGMSEAVMIDGITSMDWYVSQYDALIAYMDYQLSRTFQVLEEEGLRENTIIVITSDHGEELAGEHDRYFCHWEHYQGNTRVPLVMILPEEFQREHGPYRDLMLDGHTGLIDVMPTVLDLMGVPGPPEMQGRSLVRDPRPVRGLASDQLGATFTKGDYKIINRSMSLDADPDVELYNLRTDPGEIDNLALSEPSTTSRLQSQLLAIAGRADGIQPPTEPSGILHESDFDDPVETTGRYIPTKFADDAFFDFGVIMDPDSNRVLHGKVVPGGALMGENENFKINVPLISPPYTSYSAEADIKLLSGKAAMKICYSVWAFHGYIATITENELTLTRIGLDGEITDWGTASFAFGYDRWRRVQFEAAGHTVRVYVDGVLALEGNELEPGTIWGTTYFAVSSTGGEVYVDNFKVEK